MQINKLSESNVNMVRQIEEECFAHPWSLDSIRVELDKEGSFFFVAEDNGSPVGYIGFNIVLDEGYIANVAVRHKYRRQGIAKKLIQTVIDTAINNDLAFVTLEVRPSNRNAVSLYKKYGFEEVGRRKNFYRDPTEDGLIMTKFLRNNDEDTGN